MLAPILLFILTVKACIHSPAHTVTTSSSTPPKCNNNTIPLSTREHWIHKSNTLSLNNHPCPFAPFGTAIVNHTTSNPHGDLICTGSNQNSLTGNPTLHGEIAAINNCSSIFLSPRYNMTPAESLAAFQHLSIYTNAESCPMCAAAVRWAGFREYVYGVSIEELIGFGWGQLDIGSEEVIFSGVGMRGRDPEVVLGGVGRGESGRLFGWQFRKRECPGGCERREGGCRPVGRT
ncbi:cytidine deaminase-like protein [Apiosordaria backusii]|uniref:Cytidine deaminase-like protein n=1 Tax=Apiosordaria backusii TaxID=314023 RepID=A0AA40B2L3_9PEZI|nr:cytidine deaminase-like protein [Apiosordaria backusii]